MPDMPRSEPFIYQNSGMGGLVRFVVAVLFEMLRFDEFSGTTGAIRYTRVTLLDI
jgi:hypothetical protein